MCICIYFCTGKTYHDREVYRNGKKIFQMYVVSQICMSETVPLIKKLGTPFITIYHKPNLPAALYLVMDCVYPKSDIRRGVTYLSAQGARAPPIFLPKTV